MQVVIFLFLIIPYSIYLFSNQAKEILSIIIRIIIPTCIPHLACRICIFCSALHARFVALFGMPLIII